MYWICDGQRQLDRSESKREATRMYRERLGEGYDRLTLIKTDEDGRETVIAQEASPARQDCDNG